MYLVPNSCMQIVSCTCRTVAYITIYANARNMASATLEHAVVVVVALLFYVHGKHLRSCRDGQLT